MNVQRKSRDFQFAHLSSFSRKVERTLFRGLVSTLNTTIRACITSTLLFRIISLLFFYHFSVRPADVEIDITGCPDEGFFSPLASEFRERVSFVSSSICYATINLSEIPSRRSARKFRGESRRVYDFSQAGEGKTDASLERGNNVCCLVFPCAAVRMKMLLLNQSFRE